MDEVRLLRLTALFALLVGSVYSDIAQNKIYNWLTYSGIALGLALAGAEVILSGENTYLLPSGVGLVLGFGIFAIPYYFGWMGGGDVKLMAAIGALQGAELGTFFILRAIFYTSLFGACMALLLLIWRGRLWSGLRGSVGLLVRPRGQTVESATSETIPYGVAIVAGTLWALLMKMWS